MEYTGLKGFDIILDYSSSFQKEKRNILKIVAPLGKIATKSHDLQLDPPESQILNGQSASIGFLNDKTLIRSGQYDGVIMSIIQESIEQVLSKKLIDNHSRIISIKSIAEGGQHELDEIQNEFIAINMLKQ
ncbi:UNKNOWN [Stylonychia lemnae]|uniref:Uncharacterized protein n=1 Tax=Stylonychia lemnae TaxID=5949 RepID=A0A078B7B4_STYLE|nr:UNKNOWN [Stylonychia lemnae]|eukprot:CDW89453.1 UNKNOWN [Stylonychia lemnae]